MSFIAYINISVAVIGLFVICHALHLRSTKKTKEFVIGDVMVLVAYLLMINTHWLAQQSSDLEVTSRAWHAFDLIVLLNILLHAQVYASKKLNAKRKKHDLTTP